MGPEGPEVRNTILGTLTSTSSGKSGKAAPATLCPDTATILRSDGLGGSARCVPKEGWEGSSQGSAVLPQGGPVRTPGARSPEEMPRFSAHLLRFPYQLTCKGTAVSERSGLRHKLGCVLWAAGVPKTAVLRGCERRAKRGAGGRLPAFPFNGNYALFASRQKGVSQGQLVREGGPPRGEGAGGRGAHRQRQLLGLKDTSEKSRSLQNLDFSP